MDISHIVSGAQSLDWVQIAGVASAFVLLCDRLAKVIPSKSFGTAVGLLQKTFAILGVKVPDVQ